MPASPHELRLGPLTRGDIFRQTISLYRKNFVTLVGIVVVITVPLVVFELIGSLSLLPPSSFMSSSIPFIGTDNSFNNPRFVMFTLWGQLGLIIRFVTDAVQMSVTAITVSEWYLGRSTTLRQAYRMTWQRRSTLLPTLLTLGVLQGPLYLLILSSDFWQSTSAVIGWYVCLVLPITLIIYLTVVLRWLFATQVATLENIGGSAALRRSWNLVRGSFWRVLNIYIALLLLPSVLPAVPGLVIISASTLFPSYVVMTLISTVVTTVSTAVVTPFYLVAMTMLYYDLRVRRKEGFNLRRLGQQLVAPNPSEGA